MNLCIINPPSAFLTNERVFPPLGILRLSTYLEQQNINVKIYDMISTFKYDEISKFIIDNNIDVIGITAVSPQLPNVIEIAKYIKRKFPKIKLIMGGPHITMAYSSLKYSNRIKESFDFLHKLFDVLVIGYGEYAMLDAIKFDKKIIDAEEDKYKLTDKLYEDLPYAKRDFIDIDSYHYYIDDKRATSLIGQLGCPFKCAFCGGRHSPTYNKGVTRSHKHIIDEIDFLVTKYDYRGFMFYDDEINLKREAFNKLLHGLIDYQNEKGIELFFRGFSRSDLLTDEQAALMYEAGFRWLLLGFESGSDRILKNMNKHTTIEKNTRAVEIAKNHNLKVKALMSIGHAGESYESIEETKQWLKSIEPDETDVTVLTLYPGTDYFDKAVQDGDKWVYTAPSGDKLYSNDISFLNDKTYYKSKENENSCYVWTEFLSSKEILKCQESLSNG
jgi:anaerobic magnesium-protoporphyrin IX monomethyl ester cyclase